MWAKNELCISNRHDWGLRRGIDRAERSGRAMDADGGRSLIWSNKYNR